MPEQPHPKTIAWANDNSYWAGPDDPEDAMGFYNEMFWAGPVEEEVSALMEINAPRAANTQTAVGSE